MSRGSGGNQRWLDVGVGLALAVVAGLVAASSSRLTFTGVILVAVAGSIFGWAAMHYVTPPVDRTLATIGVVVALAVGTWGGYAFQAPLKRDASQPQIQNFIDPDKLAVEDPVDANKPFVVSDVKPTQVADRSPYASMQPSEIVNRGKPMVVSLYGSGVSSYSLVSFDMTHPDGSTFFVGESTYAAENGTFRFHFLWFPEADLGIQGNDGGWPIVVTDRYGGQHTTVQLNIVSDGQTPPAARWAEGSPDQKPAAAFQVSIATSGRMCTSGHAVSMLGVKGATPGGGLTAYYLNAQGEQIAEVTTAADALGELAQDPLFWDTQNCHHGLEFEYTVVVIDGETGIQAKGGFFLSTLD